MFRTLPPAGHPIRFREIISTIKRREEDGNFLEEWFPDISTYLVSSGSAALTLSLLSLKRNLERTEVILPAYTCPSLVASVVKSGLTPVLCDLKPYSFQLDLDLVRSKIGLKTLAVMAVHLFGTPENIFELSALTKAQGIYLIEDAAQAFRNKPDDGDPRPLDINGDLIVLSFGRGKPLSLLNGGAVLVNNEDLDISVSQAHQSFKEPNPWVFLSKYLLSLSIYSVFIHPRMYWLPSSLPWLRLGETNFSLEFETEIIGPKVMTLGNRIFQKYKEIKETRIYLAKLYREKLDQYKDAFAYFPDGEGESITLLRFPVILKNKDTRDSILQTLEKKGLGATGSYPVPLNELDGVGVHLMNTEEYPNAKKVSERILTLPLHEFVKLKDIEDISQIIAGCL